MIRVIIRPEAEGDIAEAYAWYERQRPGLGGEFLDAVEQALERIRPHPKQWAVVHAGLRRILLRRFPYAMFFSLDENHILVVAVLHAAQNRERLKNR